jgi:hypothetical protein
VLEQILEAIMQRAGTMNDDHRASLRSRITGQGYAPQLGEAHFRTAVGVCISQMERVAFNMMEAMALAHSLGTWLLLSPAEDSSAKIPLEQAAADHSRTLNPNTSGNALAILPLVAGMPIVIKDRNRAPSHNYMNNSHGIFLRCVLHEEDLANRPATIEEVWVLNRPPKLALVYIPGCTLQFTGLPAGVIPLKPKATYFNMTWAPANRGRLSIKRLQQPFEPGFWVTTYGVQGQSEKHILLDLVPPAGIASDQLLAELYTSVSRCESLEGISILRQFPVSVLHARPSLNMLQDTARLYKLFQDTLRDIRADGGFVPEDEQGQPPA